MQVRQVVCSKKTKATMYFNILSYFKCAEKCDHGYFLMQQKYELLEDDAVVIVDHPQSPLAMVLKKCFTQSKLHTTIICTIE